MQLKFIILFFVSFSLTAVSIAQKPLICRYPLAKNKEEIKTADTTDLTKKPSVIRMACHATLMPAEPLYIRDGMMISTEEFNQTDPNTITSLTILKDASATALYGSRGAQGVILLTTRLFVFVKDEARKLPVAGAVVEIENSRTKKLTQVLTDSLGRFEIPFADREQPVRLIIFASGYETKDFQWNPLRKGIQEIRMQTKFSELEEVKVVGYASVTRKGFFCGSETVVSDCRMGNCVVHSVAISDEQNAKTFRHFSVYPNPAPRNSVLQISVPAAENKEYNIRLLSADGKIMTQQKRAGANGKNVLPLQLPSGITAGVYLVSVSDEKGKPLRTMQVVIQ